MMLTGSSMLLEVALQVGLSELCKNFGVDI